MSHPSLGRRIFRDTANVSLINTAGQLVAYLMTAYVAATFGADWRTDALGLALTIPMFTANVVREAVRSVLAPTLVELRVRGSPRLAQVARQSLVAVTVGATALALLLALATPTLTGWLGYQLTDAGQALLHQLSLELLPMLPLLCLSGALASILVAQHRFGLAATLPGVDAVVKIVVIAAWARVIGIHSQAWGNVFGALAGVAVLGIGVARLGYLSPAPTAAAVEDGPGPSLGREILYPLIGLSLLQLNPYVDRLMASPLQAGSVTALGYAEKVAAIPHILFGAGFYGVILTHWSEVAAAEGPAGLRRALRNATAMVVFLLAPVVTLLAALRADLVALLFQRGAFDAQATALTSAALGFLAVALLPNYLSLLVSRAFLALQDRRAPMWLGIGNAAGNVTLNWLLVGPLGLAGITLSTALTLTLVTAVGWVWLRRRLGALDMVSLVRPTLQVGLASLACGATAWLVQGILPGAGSLALAVRLALGGGAGMLVYLALTWALRVEEAAKVHFLVRSALRARLVRLRR